MGPHLLLIISSNHIPLCSIHTMMSPEGAEREGRCEGVSGEE